MAFGPWEKSGSASVGENQPGSVLPAEAWHNAGKGMFARSAIAGRPMTVVLSDLDRFKDVNDVLGHPVGDDVLEQYRGVAAALEASLRIDPNSSRPADMIMSYRPEIPTFAGDGLSFIQRIINQEAKRGSLTVGKIGGDEVGIACEDTDAAGAAALVTRYRELFTELLAQPENTALRKLGLDISIGVSTYDPRNPENAIQSFRQMLEAADADLRENKLSRFNFTEEQLEFLASVFKGFQQHELRIRDIGKIAVILGRKGLLPNGDLAE